MNIISILLGAITLTASAQDYPLPSTRIYGSLQVDSAFRSDFDGTIFVNDSINIPTLGWTTLAGAYAIDGSNLNTAAYYPDGLGQALPSYVVRMANGDTVSNLNIFAGPNGVDQLFALEATIGEGKSGYEVQVVDGQAAAQMYATNFDGSTNLTVIKVDTLGAHIYADDYNVLLELAPTGMKYVDGTEGNGKVLTSDASGNATWQDPSSTSWSLAGNAGTVPDVNFLGTTDSIPLIIRANAASTEPNSAAGIYIEGSSASDGPGLSILGTQSRTTGGNVGLILAGSSADGSPDIQLQPANGLLHLANIGESDGYVLTSDATGNATWEPFGFVSDSVNFSVGGLTYALDFNANYTNSNFAILYDYDSSFELKGDNNYGYESAIGLVANDSLQGINLRSGNTNLTVYTDSAETIKMLAQLICAEPSFGGDSIFSFIANGYVSFPAFETLYGEGLISVGNGGVLTTINPADLNFSTVPAYANNTAAEAALGPGKLYYTDVAGEYILKVSH